ncbi:carboxypeptidase-like regulatory domain-containing protein [Leptolyngbya sp. AN02str]|uniref:carboxypeptidase-like regulatory domain-containing protein n=1 Tax=Leptolyngbya sp. AN02str TaxID=3423363 RepID=UPI003D317D0D
MLKLTKTGQRVTIAGQVIDTAQQPIAGARVEITQAPAAFTQRLALKAMPYGDRWEHLQERCDRTHTAPDGLFYFTDVPPGHYTLTASYPKTGLWLEALGGGGATVGQSAAIAVEVQAIGPDLKAGSKPPFQVIQLLRSPPPSAEQPRHTETTAARSKKSTAKKDSKPKPPS